MVERIDLDRPSTNGCPPPPSIRASHRRLGLCFACSLGKSRQVSFICKQQPKLNTHTRKLSLQWRQLDVCCTMYPSDQAEVLGDDRHNPSLLFYYSTAVVEGIINLPHHRLLSKILTAQRTRPHCSRAVATLSAIVMLQQGAEQNGRAMPR